MFNFKFISISKKINIANFILALVMLTIATIILNWYESQTEKKVYEQVSNSLKEFASYKIQSKIDVGITNAISIANDENIQESIGTDNRSLGIYALKTLATKMKESTPFDNIKIHLHTKDNKSFLRSWNQNKYGDDLSSFRKTVVSVNHSKKPLSSFEVGNLD